MRKTIGLIFAALFLLAGLAIDSNAQQTRRPYSINSRERRQQKRISAGIRTGRLTAAEAYRLERQQYNLRRAEARYRRSGNGLSWRERYNLQRRLNRSSRTIYRQKHDKQSYRYRTYKRRPV